MAYSQMAADYHVAERIPHGADETSGQDMINFVPGSGSVIELSWH